MTVLGLFGAFLWIILFFLPWRPWSVKEQLDSRPVDQDEDLNDLTVLIPARNEELEIVQTLTTVKAQGDNLKVILIDDQSTDKTVELAKQTLGEDRLTVISGKPLESGWAGKIWALEQGRQFVKTPYTLLMDADIELSDGIAKTLLSKMKRENLGYVSLMAKLQMKSFWEKTLITSYIYFFKLLYPFSISNKKSGNFGVAAGGCNLVRTEALEAISGFSAIKDAFIDDCSLATALKTNGFGGWTGLTRSVSSHRNYTELSEIWELVSRFAYTYLRYSPFLLAVCTFLMLSCFFFLPMAFLVGDQSAGTQATLLVGMAAMLGLYFPTVRFYKMNPAWVLSLPLAGILYLAMTWTSAIRYHQGKRTQWKGRTYSRDLNIEQEEVSKENKVA